MNKKIYIISYLLILLGLVALALNKMLDIDFITSNHFNIITISTVFAGFMFTSLGIIIGFNSNQAIRKFERISTMDKIYKNIIIGIIFSIISVCISLVLVIVKVDVLPETNSIKSVIGVVAIVLELYFLILTIVQFVIYVKHTYFAISVVRQDIKSKLPTKEDMEETLKQIK